MIGRNSGSSMFNIYKFSEVLGLRSMEVTSKRDDFIVDALFYFETVQRFEYMDEIFVFAVSLGKVS